MSVRISLKTFAITFISVLVLYAMFGWLILPRIIHSQAERYIVEMTGRHLTLDQPKFNPFLLDLQIANLRLNEPDGKLLLSIRTLEIDISISSLFRRALVFDFIRLDGPEGEVVLTQNGKLNWLVLLDELKGSEVKTKEKSHEALPRLDIQHFVLSDGRLNFSDDKTGFHTHFDPLALELRDISTLPDDQGSYKIEANTGLGAHILWQGRMELAQMEIKGTFEVDGVDLELLAPYLKNLLPTTPPKGLLSMSTDYRVFSEADRLDLTLDNAKAKVNDLRLSSDKKSGPHIAIDTIEIDKSRFNLRSNMLVLGTLIIKGSAISKLGSRATPAKLMRLDTLAFEDVRIDFDKHDLALAHVGLGDGELMVVRHANGNFNVIELLQAALLAAPAKLEEHRRNIVEPWHYSLDKFELKEISIGFRDEKVSPAADFMARDISLNILGISDDLANPLPIEATLRSRDGGRLRVSGKIVPSIPSTDLLVRLYGLSLKPVQPYLNSVAKLTLEKGKLDINGRARYGKRGGKFKGSFELSNLRLVEDETNVTFLAWKSMLSRDMEVSQKGVDIGELGIDGLECRLIIDKNKSVNLTQILRKADVSTEVSSNVAQEKIPDKPKEAASNFLMNIDRVKISNGSMDYADYSLLLPFGANIHDLNGSLVSLSSRPDAEGQVELDGHVDEYGLARARGMINLFNPTDHTDIKVVFRNVEMVRLTPYSATFAGRNIVSGKLSLDLEYKIKKRQLEGKNQIVMDKLTLGDRVESPSALSLPLDLAIAILEDSEGRIDLGLPVSGSLDDPKFSYGSLIWKAFVNIIGKIATAPFRALASLFGGGEKFEFIAFEFGKHNVSPPEEEKLVHLANMLNKRPKLSLTVHGVYADTDRVALQDLQLRRKLANMAGQHLGDNEDPGMQSTNSAKVQSALEKLYSEKTSSSELAARKAAYRAANPGMLQEGVGEKMVSFLSGMFREKRTLNTDEVEQLKGTDFYGILFQRLRDLETVTDTQLQDLAKARGNSTIATLQAAGFPLERIKLAASEKVPGTDYDVPLKLELGTDFQSSTQLPASPTSQIEVK